MESLRLEKPSGMIKSWDHKYININNIKRIKWPWDLGSWNLGMGTKAKVPLKMHTTLAVVLIFLLNLLYFHLSPSHPHREEFLPHIQPNYFHFSSFLIINHLSNIQSEQFYFSPPLVLLEVTWGSCPQSTPGLTINILPNSGAPSLSNRENTQWEGAAGL